MKLGSSDVEYFAGYVPELWDKFDSLRSFSLGANQSLAKIIYPPQ
ncbi:MAG: hypothetical protein WCK67_12960 [bacterium]